MRKILLALAALAVAGTAVFTIIPQPAGAAPVHHYRGYHVWRPAVRFYNAPITYGSCYVRRVVPTPFGPRTEWVNVCY
jgi:hypothetical protein